MTATEVLRRMLDERGVEWTANDGNYVKETCWPYEGELMAAFAEYDNGTTRFACDTWCFTPAQAIAATLGSCNCSNNCTNSERTETCYDTGESRIFHCSECGIGLDDVYIDDEQHYSFADFPRFCPWCGAKVASE